MLALTLVLLLQTAPSSRADYEKHVRALAGDDMKGRDNGTEEGRKASQYVADRFREYGLRPGGKDGFFHEFSAPFSPSGKLIHEGRNVVGLLEGEKSDEYVIVAAHHDARGVIEDKIQNGADDNASGVALVLELARTFAASRPRRSMLFISFDAEEDGLIGSREFVKSGLYDPDRFAAMFVFDLIAGDLFDWEKDRLYALGSECSPQLFDRVGKAGAEAKDLEVVRAGIYLIEPYPGMARSDYHAFRSKGVPFIFFTSGTPWYYHTEHDDVERLNFSKLEKAGRFIHRAISETVSDDKRPAFRAPRTDAEDIGTLRNALRKILESPLKLQDAQRASCAETVKKLEGMTQPDEKVLQKAMLLVLSAARIRP